MDFVIELIGDVLEEVLSWLIESTRIPKAIQYMIVSAVHIVLLILFGVIAVNAELLWAKLLCGLFFGLFLVCWYFVIWKIKQR